jgi:hypothetical protein
MRWTPPRARLWRALLLCGCAALCVAAAALSLSPGEAAALDPRGTPAPTDAAPDTADAEAEVRAALALYFDAAKRGDGAAAVASLDPRFIRLFDDYLALARAATRDALTAQPLETQVMVRLIRARVPHLLLWSCDGQELLRYALNENMLGQPTEVKAVSFPSPDHAVLKDGMDGQVDAYKSDGRWRFDLTVTLTQIPAAFTALATQEGMTLDALLDLIVEKSSNGLMTAAQSWEPLTPMEVIVKPWGAPPYDLKAPSTPPDVLKPMSHLGYKALFPENPTDQTQPIPGGEAKVRMGTHPELPMTFAVIQTSFPAQLKGLLVDSSLQSNLTGFLADLPKDHYEVQWLALGNHFCYDYRMVDDPNGLLWARTCVTGAQQHTLLVGMPRADRSEADVATFHALIAAFFSSFEVEP